MNILQNKLSVFTMLLLLLIGAAFYWFEYRPAQIRHDCSWVKEISPATPVEPAITKEDADVSQREYDECIKEKNNLVEKSNIDRLLWCGGLPKQERPAVPAKPETEWRREAIKMEYDFCIHEKGL